MRMRAVQFLLLSVSVLALASCAGGERSGMGSSGTGMFKIGNPYTINGQRYYPKEDYSYNETGIASWYGPGFDGRRTANGEVFDTTELTAAHRTLPMPSLVRVTNLENGRSVVVRINDRGPFAAGRVIDLSQRAAQLLDFERVGTAKVRVSILAIESRAIADAAKKRYRAEGVQTAELIPAITSEEEGGNMPQVMDETTGEMTDAPHSAPMETVEAVPLEGPVAPSDEQPIASPSQNMIRAADLAPRIPDPKPRTVPGKNVKGIFYPSPEVKKVKVTGGKRIYIQAGAFSQKANATRLSKKLSSLGPTTVKTIKSGSKTLYRVKVGPIASVKRADQILPEVIKQSGAGRITVE
jgi:rare lipoprotein A